MGDLWARIKASRDYIAVFTVMGAALSLVLNRQGVAWQTISTVVPALAVVYVVLAWLRPRVFPTWRLLELSLYAERRFPVTRSILPSLWCAGTAWQRRHHGVSAFLVARLRVEAELLTGDLDGRDETASERGWRDHLAAMLDERRLLERAQPGASRFLTEIPDCLPLMRPDAFAGIDRYFQALAGAGHADDRFLSEVRVASAYVAPLYLLTGQLSQFDDNWRSIVHAYANVTAIGDPIADGPLRHLRAFQFACWIVWGPSIPVCTCVCWSDGGRNAAGFQLGYGDENTSMVLYDESPALRLALRRARRRVQRALGARAPGGVAPLAAELEAVVTVRRPGSIDRRRLCQAQAELLDAKKERLVLEFRRLDVPPHTGGRSYYSAYLWVMFVLERGPGNPLMVDGEPWRALLPFFVHGNIAESSTYAFLKDRLALEALDAIDAVLQEPGTPPELTFAYVSAIDDPGCGSSPLFRGPGMLIKETLTRLLADRFAGIASRVRIPEDPRKLQAANGMYYAAHFSSCHLPETIGTYFTCLEHLGNSRPHGAKAG